MKKRRITLNLDEDLVEALEDLGGRSLSAAANETLRDAVSSAAHRAALLRWLDELDAHLGSPSPSQLVAADEILDSAEGAKGGGESAA